MFLMRANPLRRQVGGGWALEIESFLGPVKWHRAIKNILVLQDRSRGAEAAAGPAEAGEHPGPRRVAQSCQGDDSSLRPAARLAWVAILVFTAPIGDGYARRNPFLQL